MTERYQGAGGYHDRNGMISPKAPKTIYWPRSKWTISFTVVVLVQALIALAIEAYVFGRFETTVRAGTQQDDDDSDARTIPTYLALFIFGFLYELGLTYDALKNRNTIQVIGICLYNLGMLVYAAIEAGQVHEAINRLGSQGAIDQTVWTSMKPFMIAGPCVIAFGSILLMLIAYKLFSEFSWDIYKSISADLRMRHRYLQYQIYIALLKFDFFFFLGFTVQLIVITGERFRDAEWYVTIVAIPVTIAVLLLAAYVCRRESVVGQGIIIVIYFAAMVYFVFKLNRMWNTNDIQKVLEYYSARTSLTTFACITICLLIVTIVTAFLCMRNFNKGLKPYVMKKRRSGAEYDAKGSQFGDEYGQPLGTVPGGRMVID